MNYIYKKKLIMKYRFLILLLLSCFALNVQAQEPKDTTKIEDVDIEDIDVDDIEVDEIDEDELGRVSTFPWNKFAVGGQLGNFQFGDQTNIGISPEIVYNMNENIAFGVDGIFEHRAVKRIYEFGRAYDANYKSNNTGGRVFTRLKPVKTFPIFAQLEYERLSTKNPYFQNRNQTNGNFDFFSVKQKQNNVNAGLGFNNGPYYLGLMYNFMHKANKDEFKDMAAQDFVNRGGPAGSDFSRNYPTNAISFRTGLNIPLGQGGGKNKRKKSKNKKKKAPEALR